MQDSKATASCSCSLKSWAASYCTERARSAIQNQPAPARETGSAARRYWANMHPSSTVPLKHPSAVLAPYRSLKLHQRAVKFPALMG
ncbi:uncharacterized protein BDW70DRAFT_55890 [Aspergillus foveolatus]|uniref:uncharacterized protein n=1 Tax=Aspergillus foveolatus TaxID=210207 RepID=UPI003CCDAE2E